MIVVGRDEWVGIEALFRARFEGLLSWVLLWLALHIGQSNWVLRNQMFLVDAQNVVVEGLFTVVSFNWYSYGWNASHLWLGHLQDRFICRLTGRYGKGFGVGVLRVYFATAQFLLGNFLAHNDSPRGYGCGVNVAHMRPDPLSTV